MNSFAEFVTLKGQYAHLVPLSLDYAADLKIACAAGELDKTWYTWVPSVAGMETEINRRLGLQAEGKMLPFAVIDPAANDGKGQAVGMTTYMNVDAAHRRLEIGSTWYAKRVQQSGLNTECKLMLLTHAFEVLNCVAVEFRTHFFNQQSRRGIERLGAKQDGILRNHMIMADGLLRDTVVYSIITNEWPTVKTHLAYQLNKPR